MKPEFKKYRDVMLDSLGRYRTTSLFYELRRSEERMEKYPPIFTTKAQDRTEGNVVYRSLKAIFFSYNHLPNYEYEFAMDVFGSWDHWIWLATKSQLKGLIADWRNEYDILLKNKAHQTLIAQAMDKEKGLNAAKMIVGDEHKGTKRGRPSKAEVERERKIEAGIRDTLEEDMERLGLKVVK